VVAYAEERRVGTVVGTVVVMVVDTVVVTTGPVDPRGDAPPWWYG
jgi:hypothetical protein